MPTPLRLPIHVLVACALLAGPTASGAAETPAAAPTADVMLAPDAVAWQPFPPGGPGAQMAVLSGDPEKPGPFVMRIKMPAGARIAPHWHPTDEHITVVQGPVAFGMGKKFDRAAAKEMPTGSYLLMPKGEPHFAWNKGESIVQVHGIGPFAVVYVNPADDPRNPTAAPH